MKSIIRILFLFLFFFISQNSFSQIEGISDWIGTWEANYKDNLGNELEETLVISWIHSDRWLQIESSGIDKKSNFKWTSTEVLTLDNNLKIVGFYYGDSGYDGMLNYKGVLEDDKIIIEFKKSRISGKTTWELKNGKLIRKGISKIDGTDYTIEVSFSKKS
jgi:hypothetical protein